MNQPLVNLSFDKLRDNKISFWTKKKEKLHCYCASARIYIEYRS